MEHSLQDPHLITKLQPARACTEIMQNETNTPVYQHMGNIAQTGVVLKSLILQGGCIMSVVASQCAAFHCLIGLSTCKVQSHIRCQLEAVWQLVH